MSFYADEQIAFRLELVGALFLLFPDEIYTVRESNNSHGEIFVRTTKPSTQPISEQYSRTCHVFASSRLARSTFYGRTKLASVRVRARLRLHDSCYVLGNSLSAHLQPTRYVCTEARRVAVSAKHIPIHFDLVFQI
jgi:hypothetical protein